MQWSGVVGTGVHGDCNAGDGCNYMPVVSASSFTTGHVWCVVGQSMGVQLPSFTILYATTDSSESLTQLGMCTPTYASGRLGQGSYEATGTLNPQAMVPGSVLLIAPSGYTNTGGPYGIGNVGYPLTVTVGP